MTIFSETKTESKTLIEIASDEKGSNRKTNEYCLEETSDDDRELSFEEMLEKEKVLERKMKNLV